MANSYDANADPQNTLIDYNKGIDNVPDAWRETRGRGVTVVVMDSGINRNHPSLTKTKIKSTFCSVEGLPVDDGTETNGHGTKVAAVIAGYGEADDNGNPVRGIRGIAPEAELINCKISKNGNYFEGPIKKAFDHLKGSLGDDPLIVNCSWNIATSQGLKTMFEGLPDNFLCVCAAGNDDDLSDVEIFFPALLQRNVSVGCFSNSGLISNLNKSLEFFLCLGSVKSCGKNNSYSDFENCSMTTAVLTGVLALFLSANQGGREKPTIRQVRSALRELQSSRQYFSGLTVYNNPGSLKWTL
jgi:subtilisin family serine protease